MLPAWARERKGTRPQRRAAPNFNLPYPPGRKPREREPEEIEIFDPFEYIPHRYRAPNITPGPSNTPPTSSQYEIVDRVNGSNGLPKYILREVKEENDGQELKYNTREEKGEHSVGQSGSNHRHEDVTRDFNPIGKLRTTLLRTRQSQKALHSQDNGSRSQLSALIRKSTSSEDDDNGLRVLSVPHDRILSYVSPLQLERFEHSRFENPTVDDMPWLASRSPVSSSLSSFSGENEDEIADEQRPKKKQKIDRPLVVIAGRDTTSLGTNASTARSSIDTLDEGENSIDAGGDRELSGNVAAAVSQPSRYGMLERRPRSTSSLGESTSASSSTVQNEENLKITTQKRALPSKMRHQITRWGSEQNLKRRTGLLGLSEEPAARRVKKSEHSQDYEVSRILAHTYVDEVTYYKVSWVGHPESESYLTWLVEEELQGAPMVLRQYKREMGIDSEESDVSDENEQEGSDPHAFTTRIAPEQDDE